MASVLKVNTLTGVTTAGSIAVTGEGNSTTTSLQQGLAKAWINFNGTGTIATRDSLNVASLTDHSEGRTGINFTNNMSNDDFSAPVGGQDTSTRTNVHTSFETQSTSMVEIMHFEGGGALDCNRVGVIVAGDLA